MDPQICRTLGLLGPAILTLAAWWPVRLQPRLTGAALALVAFAGPGLSWQDPRIATVVDMFQRIDIVAQREALRRMTDSNSTQRGTQ